MTTIFPIRDKKILIQANKVVHHTDFKVKNMTYHKTHVLNTIYDQKRPVMMFREPNDVIRFHTVQTFILHVTSKLRYCIFLKGILNNKIVDLTIRKLRNNIYFVVPRLSFPKDVYSQGFKSYFVNFFKDYSRVIPTIHSIFKKIFPNPIDIVKSTISSVSFNTIHKAVTVVKNIFLFRNRIKDSFTKTTHIDVIKSELQKSIYNKLDFFVSIKKYFHLSKLLTMPNIGSIFYTIKSNSVKLPYYHKRIAKSNPIFFENKTKNINWIDLNVTNKISSTDCLSQKIFYEAQQIKNKLPDIKLPKKSSIIIDNAHFTSGLHYHTLNILQAAIPNTFLRNLVLSCFQQDLLNQPCLSIFYNTVDIDKFVPEQSAILYSIDTLKHNQIKLTATYLGRLIKIVDEQTNKNYTTFGARTSIILSEDALPKIKYCNFIN